jgi:hypothetical protein
METRRECNARKVARMPSEPGPGPRLPEDPAAYFEMDERTHLLPLKTLVATRMRPEGVENAARYMEAAAQGKMEKRKPIDVEPTGGAGWRIVDGNSTFAVALRSGWRRIPCHIHDTPSHEEA